MNVGELRELIDGLEDDIEVCITTDDSLFINACICSCGLEEIQFENGEQEMVLVISPCEETMLDMIIEDAEDKLYQISEN